MAFYTRVVATKKSGGRATPKGGARRDKNDVGGAGKSAGNSRYTPPVPETVSHSPQWVPVLMFILLGAGALIILLYYLGAVPGGRSNWYLGVGLMSMLGGLYTATKYH